MSLRAGHPSQWWLTFLLLSLESAQYIYVFCGGSCPTFDLSTWPRARTLREMLIPSISGLRGIFMSVHFWKCYPAYLSLAVFAPIFMTLCLDIETPQYAQFSFALGRGVLLYTFSKSPGLSFALEPVCHNLATAINAVIAVQCYLLNRFWDINRRRVGTSAVKQE